MPLSYYEQFLGYDWARYAAMASEGTCLGAAVIGILSILLLGGILTGILSLFISLVLALWEFPWIYYCIPKSDVFFKMLDEKLFINRDEIKATVCIILSILTYISVSFVIITGVMLDICALLFVFSAINKIQDRRDGMIPDEEQARPYEQRKQPAAPTSSSVTQSLLQASGRFGTF